MTKRTANRISELLEKRGMTQKELSLATKITESAISHYVKGDRVPRGVNLMKIATALGTTTDYLLETGEKLESEDEIKIIKTLIARNAEDMSYEDKMELVGILISRK